MLVEIWSDVVCPWCAVGKVRFEEALARFEHADEVTLRWRSFELDPRRVTVPDEDYATLLARKYRATREQAEAMIARMEETGADAGLTFRFDVARPGNTFDAHRVLHLAHDRGVQLAVKDRFLAGYHSEGEAIADHATLVRLAAEAGLDADEVREVLAGDAYADAVRADEEQAYEYGISGVPFFVLDRRVGVSGAQPTEHLLAALRQARATDDRATDDRVDEPAHRHDQGHEHDDACADGVCAV